MSSRSSSPKFPRLRSEVLSPALLTSSETWSLPHPPRSKPVRAPTIAPLVCTDYLFTAGGNSLRTTVITDGQPKDVPDYAKVQGILIGVVAAYVVVLTIIGPENHGSHFENAKTAFESGGGADEQEDDSVLRGEGVIGGHVEGMREKGESPSPRGSVREEPEKLA